MCPPALHITLGIFFRLFTLFENACHELDVKCHLQGVGGRGYEDYVNKHRRDVELSEKIDKMTAEIRMLDQLITIFTITSSVSNNPSHIARLTQLQSLMSEKKKAIMDMVSYFGAIVH